MDGHAKRSDPYMKELGRNSEEDDYITQRTDQRRSSERARNKQQWKELRVVALLQRTANDIT